LVQDLAVRDYFTLQNALANGPSVGAVVSFDCQCNNPISRTRYRNVSQQFTGLFTETSSQVQWSGTNANGFEFHTTATLVTIYAEVGEERNGFFFS
jgi:hypothetical protein